MYLNKNYSFAKSKIGDSQFLSMECEKLEKSALLGGAFYFRTNSFRHHILRDDFPKLDEIVTACNVTKEIDYPEEFQFKHLHFKTNILQNNLETYRAVLATLGGGVVFSFGVDLQDVRSAYLVLRCSPTKNGLATLSTSISSQGRPEHVTRLSKEYARVLEALNLTKDLHIDFQTFGDVSSALMLEPKRSDSSIQIRNFGLRKNSDRVDKSQSVIFEERPVEQVLALANEFCDVVDIEIGSSAYFVWSNFEKYEEKRLGVLDSLGPSNLAYMADYKSGFDPLNPSVVANGLERTCPIHSNWSAKGNSLTSVVAKHSQAGSYLEIGTEAGEGHLLRILESSGLDGSFDISSER